MHAIVGLKPGSLNSSRLSLEPIVNGDLSRSGRLSKRFRPAETPGAG
jgi:hypothetical protein